MPTYTLSGVAVDFPYDAYEPQLEYMKTVIVALQRVRPLPLSRKSLLCCPHAPAACGPLHRTNSLTER